MSKCCILVDSSPSIKGGDAILTIEIGKVQRIYYHFPCLSHCVIFSIR